MSERATRWCDGVDPVSVAVECTGRRHIVTWRRGKIVLDDHDLAAEEAAVALGAPAPPCMQLLQVWRKRAAWTTATRPARPGFVRRPAELPLPDELRQVRELGVVRSWEREARRRRDTEQREDLYQYLRRRALAPLLAAATYAQRGLRGGPISFVEVRLRRLDGAGVAHEHEPRVQGRVDEQQTALVVALSPEWLWDVWARGIAAASGAFVLAVIDATAWPLTATVEAIAWRNEGDGERVLAEAVVEVASIELTADGYRLVHATV